MGCVYDVHGLAHEAAFSADGTTLSVVYSAAGMPITVGAGSHDWIVFSDSGCLVIDDAPTASVISVGNELILEDSETNE